MCVIFPSPNSRLALIRPFVSPILSLSTALTFYPVPALIVGIILGPIAGRLILAEEWGAGIAGQVSEITLVRLGAMGGMKLYSSSTEN
jgi:hypothetical protein